MSRTAAGIQYNARSMNGIISINADEITCSGTITSDIVKASNLLEADTPETITAQWIYNVLPQSSAVPTLGPQLTNKTYVDGAITSGLSGYVTLATNQTITGTKTHNANLKLNNTRQLIFGTSSAANINYTLPNLYYDITGGSHTFFIGGSPNLYIDTDGLNIESGKRIYFNGKRCSIRDSGTQLISDVPTSNSHSFRVNNVEQMTISSDANGTILTFPSGIVMREYSSFNWLLYQIPFGFQYKWDIDGDTKLEVEPSEIRTSVRINMKNDSRVTWWEGYINEAYLVKNTTTSTFDYAVATGYKHKFMINSVEQLNLDATNGATFAGDIRMKIFKNFYPDDAFTGGFLTGDNGGGFSFNADVGAGFNFYCNTIPSFTIESTKVIVPSNNVLQLGITGSSIGYSSSLNEIQYKVPTGKIHNFHVNGVASATIDASGVIIQSTAVGGAGFPNQLLYLSANKANYIGSSTTDMRYNCSSGGSHNFYQNGTTYLGFLNSLGMVLSPNQSRLQMGTTGQFILQHDSAGSAGQYIIPTGWVHNFQIGGVGYAQIRAEGFYSFQNNTALQLGNTNQIKIRHDPANTAMSLEIPSGFSYDFYIGGALFYELRDDTLRMLRGWQCKQGATGAYVSNNLNTSWNVPTGGLNCWIDTTRIGNFVISDYRIKENIVKARPVLERLCQVEMIEYELKDISIFKKMGRHHGFIAHQLEALFPELPNIVQGEKDAMTEDGKDIQPQTISAEATNLYLSAIQELNAKIEAQQKVIENQQKQIDQLIVLFSQSRV